MKLSWDKCLQLILFLSGFNTVNSSDALFIYFFKDIAQWLVCRTTWCRVPSVNSLNQKYPKIKNKIFQATKPPKKLAMCHVQCQKLLHHESWPRLKKNFKKELLSCGKSGDHLVSSVVRLGAVEEEMHYLCVQWKWGESGWLKFMEIYSSFSRP